MSVTALALRALIEAPRWLFVGTLFYAPLAYGSTRPWAIAILNLLLAAVAVLWAAGCVVRRMRPAIPRLLAVSVLALLVVGWWSAVNAHMLYDPVQHIFLPATPLVSWLPGGVDRNASVRMMQRITALLVALLFVCDTAHRPGWKTGLWSAVCLSGAALAAFGIYHQVTGEPKWLWDRFSRFAFGTYRYHPNAGALLNMACALALGLTVRAFRLPRQSFGPAVWTICLLLIVSAGIANVSKAAQAIMALTLLAGVAWALIDLWKWRVSIQWSTVAVTAVVLSVIATVAIRSAGWERGWQRWMELAGPGWSNAYRLGAYEVGAKMVPDAGLFGFGAGTFPLIFPHYTTGNRLAGIWQNLHQDFLQAVIEYGWLGGAALGVIFFAGLGRAAVTAWKERHSFDAARWSEGMLAFSVALGLLGVGLHSLIDFPMQIASLQLFVVTLLGCAWASGRRL